MFLDGSFVQVKSPAQNHIEKDRITTHLFLKEMDKV